MEKVNFLRIAKKAAKIADEKKGDDILLLSVGKLTSVAEYFLIVTGLSAPHLGAISEDIRTTLKEEDGLETIHREGIGSSHWAVLDYGGLIVHVLSENAREFYNIENIWVEANKLKF